MTDFKESKILYIKIIQLNNSNIKQALLTKEMNLSLEHIRERILAQRQLNSRSNYPNPKNQQYKMPPKYGERKSKVQPLEQTDLASKQNKQNFYYEEDSFGATKNENKTNRQSTYMQENDESQKSNASISNKSKKSKLQQCFQTNRRFTDLQIKDQISFEEQQVIDESFKNSSMKFYDDRFQESQDKKESILYEYFHQTQQSQKYQIQRSNQSQTEQYIPIQKIQKTARALYQYTGKQEKVLDNRIANIDDINQRIKNILDRDIGEFLRKRRISSIIQSKKIKDQKSKSSINSTLQAVGNLEKEKVLTSTQSHSHQTNQIFQKLESMVKKSESISNTPKNNSMQTDKSVKYFSKKISINRPNHMKDFTFSQIKNQQAHAKKDVAQRQQLKEYSSNQPKENLESYRYPATPIKRQPAQNKGKMIDYQIQKLNNRIRASQEKKQELSIHFKPFSVEKRNKSQSITVNSFFQRQTQRKNKNGSTNQILELPKQTPMRVTSFRQQNKRCLNDSNDKNQKQIKGLEQVREKYSQYYSSKTAIGKSIKPQQTQRLIKSLRKQVQLDQNFRNQKMQFQYCNKSSKQQMWKMVQQVIRQDYSSIQHQFLAEIGQSLTGIESIFKASIEEHNPFFNQSRYRTASEQASYTQAQESVKKLIDSFIETQTHWKKQIQQKYDKSVLQAERFTIKSTLDMENKGWIAIEDLVRFVNMGTGEFFRTRDFYLIYKRLVEPMNSSQQIEQQGKSRKRIEYEKFSYEIFGI